MKVLVLDEERGYTGREIRPLWAYREFGIQEDSVVCFRGACRVETEHMVDLEDRREGEEISSPDMVHFIVEHFDSTSMKLISARQRLLVAIAGEVLQEWGRVTRKGDDLYWEKKKLSVSIAGGSAVSTKIHLGINVESEGYGNLKEMGVDPRGLGERIAKAYAREVEDMEKSIRKTRPLG